MKKTLILTLAIGMICVSSGCSSSPTEGEGDTPAGDPPAAPTADAATDAVPAPTADNAAPADPNAPPAAAGDQTASATPPPSPAADATAAPQQQASADVPPSPAGSGQFDSYTVQKGDTLMKIAFETYGDLYRWKGILEANKDLVKDPNSIPAGTVLKVEKPATPIEITKNGDKYLIKSGDTLGTISKDVYGTQSKWKALWENNKQMIHDPNKIFAGFFLYYQPDASTPKTDTPSVTPAPMAAAKPDVTVPAPGASTATTTGDRMPASTDPAQTKTQ